METVETTEVKTPDGTAFTLIVPLDRNRSKMATFFLKEIDEETVMMAKQMIDARKSPDAVRYIIKSLSLAGSDDVNLLKGPLGFIPLNSAMPHILDIMEPLEAELKKN